MLKSLKIKNIALIDECEIEFDEGLNVLSGETGAGKSVILDSINFVLGQKADKMMILNGEEQCSATCVFDISNCKKALNSLEELEIESDGEIVIKRTFSTSGKGSIKLNGETVTSAMLRKVTKHLVDVHGQSDHFALLNQSAQLELVDKLEESQILAIKSSISEIITSIEKVKSDLSKIGISEEDRAKKLDYLDFSINEIVNAKLSDGEEEQLLEKRKKLQNLEKIMNAVSLAYESVGGDNGALDLLGSACRQLSSIENFGENYQNISSNLENCISLLQDINSDLSDEMSNEFDADEADETEKRLEEISRLKIKYGNSYSAIMSKLDEMQNEFEMISSSAEKAEKLNKQLSELSDKLVVEYKKLTKIRQTASIAFSQKLVERLHELAMKNADFSIDFESNYDLHNLSKDGADVVTFMFSANVGEPKKPLSKVISGGELSRLMLAIKSVTGNIEDAHTYIFDEIDAGISGKAATVVAENFAYIAKAKQIIAISHLPQIVAMSDRSMLIKKTEADGKTRSSVETCNADQKILEVVRLVGGDENSASALSHASELVEKCDQFKAKI